MPREGPERGKKITHSALLTRLIAMKNKGFRVARIAELLGGPTNIAR